MRSLAKVFLIDSDENRAADIAEELACDDISIKRLGGFSELGEKWPQDALFLVHDNGEAIPRLIARMAARGEWLPVVGYAQEPGTDMVVSAVLDGAVNYLTWPFDVRQAVQVITGEGGKARAFSCTRLREAQARSRIDRLTRREREVLMGMAEGLSNRNIGAKLAISPRTVEIHRARVLAKMGVGHTSEAIRIAIEASLVY